MSSYTVITTKGQYEIQAHNTKDAREQIKKAKAGKILQITYNDDVIGELY